MSLLYPFQAMLMEGVKVLVTRSCNDNYITGFHSLFKRYARQYCLRTDHQTNFLHGIPVLLKLKLLLSCWSEAQRSSDERLQTSSTSGDRISHYVDLMSRSLLLSVIQSWVITLVAPSIASMRLLVFLNSASLQMQRVVPSSIVVATSTPRVVRLFLASSEVLGVVEPVKTIRVKGARRVERAIRLDEMYCIVIPDTARGFRMMISSVPFFFSSM